MSSHQGPYYYPDPNQIYYESGESSVARQPHYSQRSLPPTVTTDDQSRSHSQPHQSSESVGILMAAQDEEIGPCHHFDNAAIHPPTSYPQYMSYSFDHSHPHYSLPSTSLQGSVIGPDATYTNDPILFPFANIFDDPAFDTGHSQYLGGYTNFQPDYDYYGQLPADNYNSHQIGGDLASPSSGYPAHDLHPSQTSQGTYPYPSSAQPVSLSPVNRADTTAARPTPNASTDTARIQLPNADAKQHSHPIAVVASSSNPAFVPEVPGPSHPNPSSPARKRLMPLTAAEELSTLRRVVARHDGARSVHSTSPGLHRRVRSNPNILGRGLRIPQERYTTNSVATSSTSEQHPSITFNLENPDQVGIPIMDILNKTDSFARMQGRTQAFSHMGKKTFTLRVLWPGYEPWSKTIAALDWKKSRTPITRVKLAEAVAIGIRDLVNQYRDQPYDPDHAEWNVGPNGIQLDQICLVALHHVSKGSWQPQLCLLESRR